MSDQKQTALSISRRGFIRNTIGTLVTLPAINGVGLFSMQRVAHALGAEDQPGTAYTNEEYAKITVVTRDEVAIVVNDVAKGEKAFVPGAKVRLTSRYAALTKRHNGNDTLEGITDEEGKVIFNIKEISENVDYQPIDEIDPYEFNGSIEVTCNGYRTFKTGLIRVHGRDVIVAPTRSFEASDPAAYPHMVSFNEWDVLYSADNQFCSTAGNDRDQTLDFEGRNFGSEECTVTLCEQGATTGLMSMKTTPKDGVLKASFTHKFSLLGGEKSLEEGKSYELQVEQGSLTYVWPLQLNVGESQIAKNVNGNFDLNPFQTKMATKWGLNFTWPDSIPLFGGSQCNFGNIFSLPINVNVDPFGFAQIAISLPVAGYRNDNGEESTQRWNRDPVVMPKEQYEKFSKDFNESFSTSMSKMSEKGAFKKSPLFKQFDITLFLQFLAAFDLRNEKHIFRGMGGAQFNLTASVVYTQQFFLGPVPLLASFTFDASAILAAMFQMHTEPVDPGQDIIKQLMSPSCWTIEPSGVNLTFTLTLAPAISAGVGIRGVASLSLKFKCSFVLSLMFPISQFWEDDYFKGKDPVHFTVQCQFFLQVVLHFVFYSNTWTIPPDFPLWTWYDNWKGTIDHDDEMSTQAADDMPTLGDLISSMRPVTSEMLNGYVEASGQLAAPTDLTTASLDARPVDDALDDQGAFDWGKVRQEDVVGTLTDGTEVTYAVYHFPGADEAFGEVSPDARTKGAPAKDAQSSTEADLRTFALSSTTVPGSSRWHRGNSVRFEDSRWTILSESEDGLMTQADDGGQLPEPKVKDVKNTGGVRPSSDVIISTNIRGENSYVYGDPHIKVVDIRTSASTAQEDFSATCSFRIGVVEINGAVRSRLIMTVLNASDSLKSFVGMKRVIDFNITGVEGVSHADLFDYDFGLAFSEVTKTAGDAEAKVDMVEIVIVSGKRAAGDSTPVTAAATDLYFTYLSFKAKDLIKDEYGVQDYLQMTTPANKILNPDGNGDGLVHSISCINCVSVSDGEKAKLLVAYLDRAGETADAAFSDAAKVRPRFLFFHSNRRGTDVVIPDNSEIVDKRMVINGNVFNDPTITRMTLSPEIQKSHTLSLQSQKSTYCFLLSFELNAETGTEGFKSVAWCPLPESALALVPWPKQDCFLTSFASPEYRKTDEYKAGLDDHDKWDRSNWVLQKAWWKLATDSSGINVLEFEPIGPDNFNFSRFALNDAGTFIFWPEGHDAVDEFVKDVYNNEIPDEEESEPLNQIRACRVRNNADGSLHFSDPFVAADLPHSIDSLEVVATHDRYAPFEVLSTELVDTGERTTDNLGKEVPLYHASNLWYTSVPNLQCATVVASSCSLPAVPAGGTALFDVTIRNDGNSFLSGCKLCMYVHDLEVDEKGNALRDADGNYIDHGVTKVGDYFDVVFADALHESPYDPKDDAGNFIHEEPDFALPPGKRSEYRVKVSIPAEWADVKYVSFHAKEPVMAEGGGLAAQAADDDSPIFQTFAVEPGTYPVIKSRTSPEQSKSQRFMTSFSVEDPTSALQSYVDAPVSVYETGTRPTPSSDGKGSAAAKGSAAKTGDGIPWGLLAGAGVAGAAMAAYSKRRLENEAAARGEGDGQDGGE